MPKPAHRRGNFNARDNAARVRAWTADPTTRCWRCNRTLAEHEPHPNGKAATWTNGHQRDGDPTSPLLPEASTCNYRNGGWRLVNARRNGTAPTNSTKITTRRW